MKTINGIPVRKNIKIDKVYQQNDIYKFVKNELNNIAKDIEYVDIDSNDFISNICDFTYVSEATTISLPNGSHLRIKSRAKSLDITRVWINPDSHGKGHGSFLMSLVMASIREFIIETKTLPKIILETTGSVGAGQNLQTTPVWKQVKFFNKFGFVVDRIDSNNTTHMILDHLKMLEYIKKDLVVSK